jgi:flagellar biosynthetic protein FlhB
VAEENDSGQKTEEATPRKLEEARKRGQIASSREVNHWFMILAASIVVMVLAPAFSRQVGLAMTRFFEMPDLMPVDRGGLQLVLGGLLEDLAFAFVPLFLLFIVAAAAPGLLQSGFMISVERIEPKLEKISVMKGFERLFSLRSIVEFGKGILKIAVVGAVATMLLIPHMEKIHQMQTLAITDLMIVIQDLSVRMLLGVLAIMTVIAAIDFLYQRFEFQKSMRMTRQEIRDELKQTEGDPMVKGRLRQIRMERARRRMMANVPKADVVITNPTHFAVALSYKPAEMAAPRLVAKGADLIAQRIREVAEEHDIPVVENPPVARALFAAVDLDQEIPADHYRAVAEIISYVFRLKGREMPR